MIYIMFVCHGNICRSTMAEFLLKDKIEKLNIKDKFYVESSGTSREEIGADTHPKTKRELDKHGVKYTKRRARQFKVEDYKKFDYIICMDENNIRNLSYIVNDVDHKVYKLLSFIKEDRDVKDPWYTGNYEETYEDINAGLDGFLNYLKGEI